MSMVLLMLLVLIALPTHTLAADSMVPGSALLQMLWALLVVCGLILVLYGLARKRFLPGRLQQGKIEVLELRHLMPKASLARIRVGSRELLIGISSGNITLITELENETGDAAGQSFDQVLKESQ